MYFHCDIVFPLIEINFNKKVDFNSKDMIDFINKGKNRKVNFVILPSLFYNGNFLQNGKTWVFTYTQKTFKFEDSKIKQLDELIEKNNKNSEKEMKEEKFEIKVYCEKKNEEQIITIETDINIQENKDYFFTFYLRNKRDNTIYTIYTHAINFKIDKYDKIEKYEFKLGENVLFTSEYIINS